MHTVGTAVAADLRAVHDAKTKSAAGLPAGGIGANGEGGPPSRAAANMASKRAASRAELVEVYRRYELRPLWLGKFTFDWIAEQPDRVKETAEIKKDLVAAGLCSQAARLDYYVCVYWIAAVLGFDEAQGLHVSTVRELRRLFGRNAASGEWQIRRGLESETRGLWRKMLTKRLSAAAVKQEVCRIRPAKASTRITPAMRDYARLLKSLKKIPADAEQLQAIIRICEDRLATRQPVSEPSRRSA